jgi:hypothetical protein
MKSALFTISIDDGHPLDLKIAELLKRYDIPATFYIPHKNSEGHPVLQTSAICELAKYFEIGSHTLDHKALTHLTDKQAWEQITQGKQELEDRIGYAIQGFSYPLGEQNPVHRKMVQTAGFHYARTTNNLHLQTGDDCYALPTTVQFFPHQRQVLLRNYFKQGELSQRYPAFKICMNNACILDRVTRLFDYAMHEHQVFHLWCHSLDLEKYNLWGMLDSVCRHIAEKTQPEQRVTNFKLTQLMSSSPKSHESNTEFA